VGARADIPHPCLVSLFDRRSASSFRFDAAGRRATELEIAAPTAVEGRRDMRRIVFVAHRGRPGRRLHAARRVTDRAEGLSLQFSDGSPAAVRVNYPSIGSGLWWAAQTVTTVGYGDNVPTNLAGQLVAVVVMLLGIGFLTVITAAIRSTFVERSRREQSPTDAEAAMTEQFRQLDNRLARSEAAVGPRRHSARWRSAVPRASGRGGAASRVTRREYSAALTAPCHRATHEALGSRELLSSWLGVRTTVICVYAPWHRDRPGARLFAPRIRSLRCADGWPGLGNRC
jgi:hypothetical protein